MDSEWTVSPPSPAAETLDLGPVTSQGAIFLARPSTAAQLLDAVRRAKAACASRGDPG